MELIIQDLLYGFADRLIIAVIGFILLSIFAPSIKECLFKRSPFIAILFVVGTFTFGWTLVSYHSVTGALGFLLFDLTKLFSINKPEKELNT